MGDVSNAVCGAGVPCSDFVAAWVCLERRHRQVHDRRSGGAPRYRTKSCWVSIDGQLIRLP